MTEERYSLRELRLMTNGDLPATLSLDRLFNRSFEEQNKIVNKSIDLCARILVENRHLKQKRSEDELTIDLVMMLQAQGVDATHDTQIGGHCDIVIRGYFGFLWIGESKLGTDYNWILKGYEQLDTRYSTGLEGQDTGSMLIFSYRKNSASMFSRWLKHLKSNRSDVSIIENDNDTVSIHKHEGTERPFTVRHILVSLYWKPMDNKTPSQRNLARSGNS
ncbi:hypothetical protein GCM10007276_07050 [Agaricicola taiwanensis]|uniref:Uncharacterized protein n=1 Tax=Agaricicola taiwanensis TaxID=591372 RepID=A0A8J2VME8_9RHOB|nr:hypothetical protein [Agaricicola taiwanensis]GGE32383.1 hypothetical protein GCM10007276_07050 [Agaricicola taiwanensis]